MTSPSIYEWTPPLPQALLARAYDVNSTLIEGGPSISKDQSDLHVAFGFGSAIDTLCESPLSALKTSIGHAEHSDKATAAQDASMQAASVEGLHVEEIAQEDVSVPASAAPEQESPDSPYADKPPVYLMGSLPAAAPSNAANGATTRLPSGWTFRGHIVSEDDLDLGCVIHGDVVCTATEGKVVLRHSSSTHGNVTAHDVSVEGTHHGRIDASNGTVTLAKSSKVDGEVRYSNIQMLGGIHRMQLQYVEPKTA